MLNVDLEILSYGEGDIMETERILFKTRASLGLSEDGTDFEAEISTHVASALTVLNQNGVGRVIINFGHTTTWGDFKDPEQTKGNEYFHLVPMYVFLSTKILFDPPPPSTVEFYNNRLDEMLWRLRWAYQIYQKETV